MIEIWRPVKDFEGHYEISNLGRLKSLKWNKIRILTPCLDGMGYPRVSLAKDGKQSTLKIHTIVAMAFLGHIPNGHKIVVDHINHIKTDNNVSNLRLVTQRVNASNRNHKGSSKYTGVSWNKQRNKWLAKIVIKGKQHYIGVFKDELDAHKAYQRELNKL